MSKILNSLLIDPQRPIIHRDLSWLQFNDRVLAEAEDPSNPLLERLKFLAITASNLDEFFMIRLASLHRELSGASKHPEQEEQFLRFTRINSEILDTITRFCRTQSRIFNALSKELTAHGVRLVRHFVAGSREAELAKKLFHSDVVTNCCPPEPFSVPSIAAVENLQLALIFLSGNLIFRVSHQSPPVLWGKSEGEVLAFFLDDLLTAFLGATIGIAEPPLVVRITRDADVSVELPLGQDITSIPDSIRKQVHSRQSRKAMRLEHRGTLATEFLQRIVQNLKLPDTQVFSTAEPLLLHGLSNFVNSVQKELGKNPALFYPPFKPYLRKSLTQSEGLFDSVDNSDFFFHLPYDSYDNYTNVIAAAVADPYVTSIQQTVYRVDALSKVTTLLKQAAKSKDVRIIIEPRARFDEINNLALAEELREAGVKVVFVTGRLKLHAKLALIRREVAGVPHLYTHVSTGNYNAKTARIYTDMAILTANPAIGVDAQRLFDAVCNGQLPETLYHLVLAPSGLHRKIISLIHTETAAARLGKPARIFAKVNALVDERIIDQLYAASAAGVQVDLLVRGACSLVPGVPGLSENIRCFSIVDRFLEHSRVYYFQHANTMFLSSADWMPRNFYSRLEIAFPVLDPRIFEFIANRVIPIYLDDRVKARVLTRNGTWRLRRDADPGTGSNSQTKFYEMAKNAYKGTSIE